MVDKNNLYKKLFILVSGVVILALSIILIHNLIGENFPHQLVINNFSEYYPEVSEKDKKRLFYQLYLFVSPGKEDVEASIIKESIIVEEEDDYSSALIDISELQRVYRVKFNTKEIKDDDVTFSCPLKSEFKYENDATCNILPSGYFTFFSTLEHSYMIDGIIHEQEASLVTKTINNYIISSSEHLSAPGDKKSLDTFTVNILENSYRSYQTYPNIIYSLSAVVDDGRTYDIYINTNNKSNVATYITRTDIAGHSTATIYSSETDRAELENWIRSLSSDVEITYEEF